MFKYCYQVIIVIKYYNMYVLKSIFCSEQKFFLFENKNEVGQIIDNRGSWFLSTINL